MKSCWDNINKISYDGELAKCKTAWEFVWNLKHEIIASNASAWSP